jgi:uncharacterized protein (UPF0332 family)
VNNRNEELIAYRLERALETLEDARILAKAKRWNTCVNRLYYACFYAVTALLAAKGLTSSKHSGVRGLFNKNYVKTGIISKDLARIYNDLFERRQEGDYADFVDFEERQVLPWISRAESFVDQIISVLGPNTSL